MLEGGDGLVDLEAAQALAVDVDDFVADAQPPVSEEEEKEGEEIRSEQRRRGGISVDGSTVKMGPSSYVASFIMFSPGSFLSHRFGRLAAYASPPASQPTRRKRQEEGCRVIFTSHLVIRRLTRRRYRQCSSAPLH